MTEESPSAHKRRYQAVFKRDGQEIFCDSVYGTDPADAVAFINNAGFYRQPKLVGSTVELVINNRPNLAIAEIICDCGHRGFLHLDPPDRPPTPWIWYVSGFKDFHTVRREVLPDGRVPYGDVYYGRDGIKNKCAPSGVLEETRAECPNCGRIGAVDYADRPWRR